MIISASRRTDIPAHFGLWFMQRIRQGYFHSTNPFNPGQKRAVRLNPGEIDAIVFWTKNPGPFLQHLDSLDEAGYERYYFLFTLNHYPRLFEPGLPSLEERIETFRALSERIGKGRVVWRYDPIAISSVTPVAYHEDVISRLAEQLHGFTDRLIFSFLDFYGKVRNRLAAVEASQGIRFTDITEAEYGSARESLARRIGQVARDHGLRVQTCAEALEPGRFGIDPGSCIDGELIRTLFGRGGRFARDRNQRKDCLCSESVDLGVYNTCRSGCIYCYANQGEAVVRRNLLKHDPKGSSLVSGNGLPKL